MRMGEISFIGMGPSFRPRIFKPKFLGIVGLKSLTRALSVGLRPLRSRSDFTISRKREAPPHSMVLTRRIA